jgi:hypothetical protein
MYFDRKDCFLYTLHLCCVLPQSWFSSLVAAPQTCTRLPAHPHFYSFIHCCLFGPHLPLTFPVGNQIDGVPSIYLFRSLHQPDGVFLKLKVIKKNYLCLP